MKPSPDIIYLLKSDLLITDLQKELTVSTQGLKNILFIRALIDYFIKTNGRNNTEKEYILSLLKTLENPSIYILQFFGTSSFFNGLFINFFGKIYKTNSMEISRFEDLVNFDKRYNLLFIEKYLYLFKIIEIKRQDCFSRQFKFKLAFFGDKNSFLYFRIGNYVDGKDVVFGYFKVDYIVEGSFVTKYNTCTFELVIKIEENYMVVYTETIVLSKSLL
ncbi:hypothetical protein CDIK_0679 [Cucumispora dikerogammari]|nr:hypothetical protein CDIK_0679 [Cucumispora dikerogammari]